jgi:hypothetical protein
MIFIFAIVLCIRLFSKLHLIEKNLPEGSLPLIGDHFFIISFIIIKNTKIKGAFLKNA